MPKRIMCPNCGSVVANHPDNWCVLAVFIKVIREREVMSERRLRKIHGATDADALWRDLGGIIDRLEEGKYSTE